MTDLSSSCKIALLLALLSLPIVGFAQPPLLWDHTIAGTEGEYPSGITLCVNNDILLTAYAGSGVYLAGRYHPNGQSICSGVMQQAESAHGLEMIEQGEFLAITYVSVDSSQYTIYNNEDIPLLRSQMFPGEAYQTHKHHLGGFINGTSISGLNSRTYVNRLDDNSNIIWSVEYDWDGFQNCFDVASDVQGNIYAPIANQNFDLSGDITLKKLSNEGVELDSWVYPSADTDAFHFAGTIKVLPDGNLFLTGQFTLDPDSTYPALLLSPDGDILNFWGEMHVDLGADMVSMPDGGYVSAIPLYDAPFYDEVMMRRYNAAGEIIMSWIYTVDFYDSVIAVDQPIQIVVTPAGEVVIYGSFAWWPDDFETDLYLAKFGVWHTDLEIAAEPLSQTSAVPAPGRFFWHGTLTNNTGSDIVTDIWVIVRGPDGYPSEPLRVWQDITVPANGVYEADLRQNIPGDAALGEYNYIVRCGEYVEGDPENSQHTIQAYFPLTVVNGWIPPTVINGRTVDGRPGGVPVDLDPPRTRGVVPAPFDGPTTASGKPGTDPRTER